MTSGEVGAAVRSLLRRAGQEPAGGGRAAWQRLQDGGFARAGLPEQLGGPGGDLRDTVAVVAACAGHPLPAADAILVAGRVLALAGWQAPDGLVLPVPGQVACRAGTLAGEAVVPWARDARYLVFATRDGRAGLVDAQALAITPGQNLAGEPRDRVVLDGARPAALAPAPVPVADALRLAGALARAVQIDAAVAAMLTVTVGYVRQRSQFGRPLARFQAVQQQLAVLAGEALAAHGAAGRAVGRLDPDLGGGPWPAEPVAVAKVRAGQAAGTGSRIAHQLHGAIGITAEYPLHRLTMPALAWRDDYGTERYWSAELAAAADPADPWAALSGEALAGDA